MIRRTVAASAAAAVSIVGLRALGRRAADRLLDAPSVAPGEAAIAGELDALGGEVIRLRSRDGLRLAGRWLPADAGDADWVSDPHEAILVLHGYSGSVAPDLVEYARFLRGTANVLGIDFRGHGDSDAGPSTFGMLEAEDIAGALGWLGERGIRRVALFGTSMGGMAAITAVAVLGDGTLGAADAAPDATRADLDAPRPLIAAVVADFGQPGGRARGREPGGHAHGAVPGRAGVRQCGTPARCGPARHGAHPCDRSRGTRSAAVDQRGSGYDRAGRGRPSSRGRGRADGGAVDGPRSRPQPFSRGRGTGL